MGHPLARSSGGDRGRRQNAGLVERRSPGPGYRTPRKFASKATAQALRFVRLPLFIKLDETHLRELTDSARGRLLNIKYKFALPGPEDYEFVRHGRFDPYPHEQLIDKMRLFVERIQQQMGPDGSAVMRHLLLDKAGLSAISDGEKQKLVATLVRVAPKHRGLFHRRGEDTTCQ